MKPRTTLFGLAGLALAGTLALGTRPAEAAGGGGPSQNLVEVAIAVNASGPYAGSFDTLIAAVQAADPKILEALTRNGQRTVFAPTDDAFADLGLDETNVASLPRDFLSRVLAYHVSPGRRLSGSVVEAERVRMLAGGFLTKEAGSTVLVDNLGRTANLVVPDVMARNGVIHVIDAVVLPEAP